MNRHALAALVVTIGGLGGALAISVRAEESPDGVRTALDTALDDERHAAAFYAAVMERFGEVRPFSNVINAENNHEAALLAQYARLGLEPPADAWVGSEFEVPATIEEACDASVVAEVRNVRLYDTLIPTIGDEQVRVVFENLRAASNDRHLPAFQRNSSGWARVAKANLTEPQKAQRVRADAATTELFSRVFNALASELVDQGPDKAVGVCSEIAPEIARSVGAEAGVRIGRTSWKLRNPKNGPPVWAELAIDDRPTSTIMFADRAGRMGVLKPIKVSAFCLQCHGGESDLGPGVGEALAARYPEDHATGFAEGDLRGWFWVEVPAPAPDEPAP